MSSDYPHKCPSCGSDAYIGLTLTQCTARTCENYEEPKVAEPESSPPSAQESTDSGASHSPGQYGWTSPAGARPSGSQDDDDIDPDSVDKDTDPFDGLDIDWATVQLNDSRRYREEANRRQKAAKTVNMVTVDWLLSHPEPLPSDREAYRWYLATPRASQSAKQVTPSTPLSEVRDSLSEGEKSQSQQLFDSLYSIYDHLGELVATLSLAKSGNISPRGILSGTPYDLSSLRAKLPGLEVSLGRCDQFLHRLQSGDRPTLGKNKSEEQCQKDSAPSRSYVDAASLSKYIRKDLDSTPDLAQRYSQAHLDYLSSNASNSRSQSYETQPPERWQDYADCTYLSDSQGFEKGLSLYLETAVTLHESHGGHTLHCENTVSMCKSHGWRGHYTVVPLPPSHCPMSVSDVIGKVFSGMST